MRPKLISLPRLHGISRADKERALELIREKERRLDRDRCEGSLVEFLQGGWRNIDPNPYVPGWHLDAIAEHLEAIVRGEIRNLLINVPPRTSKSSMTSVAFPAWVWTQRERGPLSGPQVQFLFTSYAQSISIRDSTKTRRLIESPWYQDRWGDRFQLTGDQNTKIRFENSESGYRLATSTGGSLTGEGAAIIVADDAHNAIEAESEVIRQGVLSWWDEALSTRLNDPKTGAFIVVMQRLHQEDLAGHILDKADGDWTHLCLPMEYDPSRHCVTSIGWEDPRTEDGELLCPERFGPAEVKALKSRLGPAAAAGQLQQIPVQKGGGIFKTDWWKLYETDRETKRPKYPPFHVIASLDPAYTEKEENDPSGFTIWGLFKEDRIGPTKVVLLYAWRKRLELHGTNVERKSGESNAAYIGRSKPEWGLVEQVAHDCKRLKVDTLLIESKASGLTVAQEIRRLYRDESFGVQLINPGAQDKVARAYSVQHLFADGLVFAPDRDWADMVITEMAQFPKAKHDDLVDSSTMALRWLRDNRMALRHEEQAREEREAAQYRKPASPLYEV